MAAPSSLARAGAARSAAWIERTILALVLASWLCAAWFLLSTLQRTLGPSPVEVEQFWEAGRLRHGHPLYVDPLMGAFEDGAPPTRKLVLYTPVWPQILALLPEPVSVLTLRIAVGFGWLLGLPALAWRLARAQVSSSRRSGLARPALPVLVALVMASFCLLSRSAWCAAADAPAALIVGYALTRTISRNRIDVVSAAMFAAAPFLKPNVCMISLSCFAMEVIRYRQRALKTLWAAALSGGAMLLFCHMKSGGVWLTHLRMSTVQPFLWVKWHEWLQDYFFFLGLPHLVVLVSSALLALRARGRGEAVWRGASYAFAAAGSTWLWSAWLMGKAGAGTHYYLEPTVAMIVLLGVIPKEAFTTAHRGAALLMAALSLAIGAPLFRTWTAEARDFDAAIPRVRELCSLAPGETVLSSNVRMEWALLHRVVIPEYQTSYLTRAGRIPLEVWKSTLLAPNVGCFALEGDLPASAPLPVPGRESPSVWYVEAGDALRDHFRAVGKAGNFSVFKRK